MHQLVQVARVNTPRAPHDVNDVLMALGGDQTHSGPTALNQGVGAHRRAVCQQPDTAAKIGKGQTKALGHGRHRIQHALGKMGGC